MIVRFSPAAREEHFIGPRRELCGDRIAALFKDGPCLPPKAMDRGGIAVRILKMRRHCLDDFGCDGSRGAMIQVNELHGGNIFRIRPRINKKADARIPESASPVLFPLNAEDRPSSSAPAFHVLFPSPSCIIYVRTKGSPPSVSS